jgi:hypothetical protein
MKLSSLIVILVLFSSSLFANATLKDWENLDLSITDILDKGYELKEVTIDPTQRENITEEYTYKWHRILYHFISYKKKRIIMCSVDITDTGRPTDTKRFNCYASPQ